MLAPAELVTALQRGIAEGLGPAHGLSGSCSFEFEGEPFGFTVRLAPGHCSFGALEPGVKTAIRLTRQLATMIVESKGAFDFRAPTFVAQVEHTGDATLYIDLIHSLLRPAPEAEARFRRAEELSQRSAVVSELYRLAVPSEQKVAELIDAGLPFVVTGALDGWELSIDRLLEKYADARVKVATEPNDETFSHFVARARNRSGTGLYTLGTSLPHEMAASFVPVYFGGRLIPQQLWMGSGANEHVPVTPLHRDVWCGLLGQVHGRKRLRLYPPHQAAFLYPRSAYSSYQLCWATPSEPDSERHPLLRLASGIDVVLEPGELLVQPAGWFHEVYSLSAVTMSVSSFLEDEIAGGR